MSRGSVKELSFLIFFLIYSSLISFGQPSESSMHTKDSTYFYRDSARIRSLTKDLNPEERKEFSLLLFRVDVTHAIISIYIEPFIALDGQLKGLHKKSDEAAR